MLEQPYFAKIAKYEVSERAEYAKSKDQNPFKGFRS